MPKEEERENVGPAIETMSCVLSNQSKLIVSPQIGSTTLHIQLHIFNLAVQLEGPVKHLASPIVQLNRSVV